MIIEAFTDGASRGNPGESGIGILARDRDGRTVIEESGYIGRTTNNIAEYMAMLALLHRVSQIQCDRLIVHSDSELMVRQLTGSYKVKNPGLREYYERVRTTLEALPFPVEIRHVPREQNREADRLANEGIDSKIPVVGLT